jgi:hypothetical protein
VYDETNEIEAVQPSLPIRRSWTRGVFVLLVLFTIIVGAGAYLWLPQATFQFQGPSADTEAQRAEPAVSLKDFQSYQQQVAGSLQSATEDIAAQKANIQNLSSQLSALSAKVDALQSASAPPPPAPPAVSAKPPGVGAKRKISARGTTGPISVGGVPLPVTPPDRQ